LACKPFIDFVSSIQSQFPGYFTCWWKILLRSEIVCFGVGEKSPSINS